MTASLVRMETRLVRAPLALPWGPTVRELTYVAVEVEDSEGLTGSAFTWTPSIGAEAARALLDHDIRTWALGRPVEPQSLWPELWAHLHEAGGAGVTTIAMAGLDLALWDLQGRREHRSVSELIGRRRDSIRVYASGVNLHYPLADLCAQAGRWVEAGYSAVKIKVGSASLLDDIERVRAVREIIGPDRRLMIDANQRWDLASAERAIGALGEFDLAWIEEPLRAEDTAGFRALRTRVDVPIALGENVHTRFRFEDLLDAHVPGVIQPNIVRVGGITPFLDIARVADAAGVPVFPHLLPELSGQLALTLANETMIEAVEGASMAELGVIDGPGPIVRAGDVAHERVHVGLGLAVSSPAHNGTNGSDGRGMPHDAR